MEYHFTNWNVLVGLGSTNGLLPTRGSVMLDVVAVAMVAVSGLLLLSIFLARVQKKHQLHRSIQLVLIVLLSIAIVLFEIDMRVYTDWEQLAEPSAYFESGWVHAALWIHLTFAIPTPFVWAYVVTQALRKIEWDSESYRHRHRVWGWVASLMMFGTAVTGWLFYWIAFCA